MRLLDDHGLRLVLLSDLVARVEKGNVEDLVEAGMNAQQLDHLRSLSHIELQLLAASHHCVVTVALDTAALRANLQALLIKKELERLRDYFILNGASPAMMAKFFKLNEKTMRERCRALNVTRRPGRRTLPDLATRDRVHRAWADIPTEDLRVRYYRLHRSFPEMSLEVLHFVVTEFERNP